MGRRMQEPYEKGIANHSAPSFAWSIARCSGSVKQVQTGWVSCCENSNRDADAVVKAEDNMVRTIPRVLDRSCVVVDPTPRLKLMHENRETRRHLK